MDTPVAKADKMQAPAPILLVTHGRYVPIARLTRELLSRYWQGLPSVFVCGLDERPDRWPEPDEFLPLACDSRDWIGIVLRAVRALHAKGVHSTYLILDDHPPLDPCHPHHLAQTLPAFLHRLNAACISLYGWDHKRDSKGRMLGRKFSYLQRQAGDYAWRFGTAPAIWSLEALEQILHALDGAADLKERGPWRFELRSGRPDSPVPACWRDASYRVCGLAMSAQRPGFGRIMATLGAYGASRIYRRLRKIAGNRWRDQLDRLYGWEDLWFEGPYPLFINGLMLRGHANVRLLTHLRCLGRNSLAEEIEKAAREAGGFPQ